MISEKNILQSGFEGENLTRKYLGEMISYNEKIYISWLILLEKNLTALYVGRKNSTTRCLEKNISHPNKITHTPLKRQMVGP